MCNIQPPTAKTADILSQEPPVVKCFDPLLLVHSRGGGSVVVISHYVSAVGFQPFSSLLSHSQLDPVSAAWQIDCTALFLSLPPIPSAPSNVHIDCAANPLAPTSTGNNQVLQPCVVHSLCSSAYLSLFRSCASSQRVSQGTVSSMISSRL